MRMCGSPLKKKLKATRKKKNEQHKLAEGTLKYHPVDLGKGVNYSNLIPALVPRD
jgi:hypothetical protein